jgi:IS30 family transposase
MVSSNTYGSLSGSFRLTPRESGAVNYLRYTKRMNMDQIASLLGRSLATVHRVTNLNRVGRVDNRGQCANAVNVRRYQFAMARPMIRLSLRLWLRGLVDSLSEAFDARIVKRILSESSGDEDAEDPA